MLIWQSIGSADSTEAANNEGLLSLQTEKIERGYSCNPERPLLADNRLELLESSPDDCGLALDRKE